jgi:ATP-binding cassette subfamily B protein
VIVKKKLELFRESIKLVWQSAPAWTTLNAVLSLLRGVFPLVLIWLLKEVIDGITSAATVHPGSAITNVLWPITALVVFWFLDEATSDFSNYVRKQQSLKLEYYMYGLLHAKSVKLDLINFEQPAYFDCLARASREAPWRPNSILNNLVGMFRSLLSVLLLTGLILSLHWTMAVLLLVANIPGIWLRLYYSDILYNFRKEQTPESRKSAYFNWLLTGDRPSRELRLFGLGNYFRELFNNSFRKQKDEELRIIRKRALIEFASNLFKALAFLVTLLFVANATIGGSISLGKMAMFLVAFRQGMIYIKELFGSASGLYEDGLFIGDTFEFLGLKENITAIEPVVIPSPLRKKIVLDNLSFTYPGNSMPAISNVSLEINKGEIIALVGANGAGKSTLVRLLCRLYDPDSGTVKFDGHDIKHFDPEKYRQQLSVVFQDFMLYNLSARENIRIGNIEEVNADGKIKKAASSTGVDNLIESLPDGYETIIGNLFEDSRELSWGEWQKIALSRALFRNSPVLILDEPSSSLDADTEYEIFNHFREIVKGRTSILISHRFTNVSLADRIIVLEKGRIVEAGTHQELMKNGGTYSVMYTKQLSRFKK